MYSIILEHCLNLNVKDLIMPQPNEMTVSVISWSSNGKKTSSIKAIIELSNNEGYLTLKYTYNDRIINYKIKLISKPSNLGRGMIWYFVCTYTNKHCRKLYLINGYFCHSTTYKSCYYEKQTYSKKTRKIIQLFDKIKASEKVYLEYYKKYRKTVYRGKPTNKEIRLKNILDIARSYSIDDFERLFIS